MVLEDFYKSVLKLVKNVIWCNTWTTVYALYAEE
jgi:hypothetical protein